jgi:hypothetical protein
MSDGEFFETMRQARADTFDRLSREASEIQVRTGISSLAASVWLTAPVLDLFWYERYCAHLAREARQ